MLTCADGQNNENFVGKIFVCHKYSLTLMGSIHIWSVHSAVYRATSEDSSSSDDDEEIDSGLETDSSSTSEDEDEDIREDGIPISATHGDGVDVLWDRIQEKVFEATNNNHIVFTVPSDGLQLR